MAPKPSVTSSTIQVKRLDQSNHSSVDSAIANRISTPPMVGVPPLLRWLCMAYSRIGWPILSAASRRMKYGPATRPTMSAVMAAITARKVRYWNTRRNPNSGPRLCSHCARLSNM